MSRVPPINSKGFFSLKAPWTLPANTVYECIAVREFSDFTNIGEDVFALVYEPKGLKEAEYRKDRDAGVKIITLASKSEAMVFVPSSYVLGYPSMDNVAYSHVVMSISLGAIPDALDLTFLEDQIQGTVSNVIGVTPQVHVNVAPSDNYVTATQHAQLEQARQEAIQSRKTDLARLLESQAIVSQQRQVIANYEAILRHHGLLPE